MAFPDDLTPLGNVVQDVENDDDILAPVGKPAHVGGVHDQELGVRQSRLPPCHVDHLGHQVDADVTPGAQPGEKHRSVARPAADFKDVLVLSFQTHQPEKRELDAAVQEPPRRAVDRPELGIDKPHGITVPGRKIGDADREFLRSRVRWMFRADEDFGQFWELCRGHAILRHCRSQRTGTLLRCATVFEDTVKTICTVNCSWSNTKLMVANLCRMFGESCAGAGEAFTFPTPERLAAAFVDDLKEAKLGFRARYILELARRVAGGALDLDAWCRERDPDALRAAILGVKGIGSYGANHLLVLLGHYGEIPCDSEVRAYLGVSPKAAQKEVERAAAKRYGKWGKYCFLAYKFERVFRRLNYVDIVDGKKR